MDRRRQRRNKDEVALCFGWRRYQLGHRGGGWEEEEIDRAKTIPTPRRRRRDTKLVLKVFISPSLSFDAKRKREKTKMLLVVAMLLCLVRMMEITCSSSCGHTWCLTCCTNQFAEKDSDLRASITLSLTRLSFVLSSRTSRHYHHCCCCCDANNSNWHFFVHARTTCVDDHA